MSDAPDTFPSLYRDWRRIPWRSRARAAGRAATLHALYEWLRVSGDLSRGLSTPRVQFFCLHHLFPDEVDPFRTMMTELAEHFEFASWSEGIGRVLRGDTPTRPVACFSSDDGLASNLALAGVLEEFGTTGCFFINTAPLEDRSDAYAASFCRVRLQARPSRFLSSADVEALLARGHEIGNHTATHVVCADTPDVRLAEEILGTRDSLEARFGPVLHFAWPYGQYSHFSELARALVFESGHVSASSVVRGAHAAAEPHTGDLCVRRDQIWATDPIEHVLYFAARSGLDLGPNENGFPQGVLKPRFDGVSANPSLSAWDALQPPGADRPSRQYAPSPRSAALNVRRNTVRSSQADQLRT